MGGTSARRVGSYLYWREGTAGRATPRRHFIVFSQQDGLLRGLFIMFSPMKRHLSGYFIMCSPVDGHPSGYLIAPCQCPPHSPSEWTTHHSYHCTMRWCPRWLLDGCRKCVWKKWKSSPTSSQKGRDGAAVWPYCSPIKSPQLLTDVKVQSPGCGLFVDWR